MRHFASWRSNHDTFPVEQPLLLKLFTTGGVYPMGHSVQSFVYIFEARLIVSDQP